MLHALQGLAFHKAAEVLEKAFWASGSRRSRATSAVGRGIRVGVGVGIGVDLVGLVGVHGREVVIVHMDIHGYHISLVAT